MAYQKLQPSEAGEIILSNTINVISPSQTPSVGGVNFIAVTNQLHDFTVAPVGRTGVITTGAPSKVIDTSANFLSSPAVQVGDTVTTTTGAFAYAYVTAVDSATELSLSADIVGTTADNYSIHQGPGFAGMVSVGDLILNVNDNTLTACTDVDQTYLTFGSNAFPDKGDVYKAYGNTSQLNSNTTAFVVYVGAASGVSATWAEVKVTTAAGNDITFSHFPTGTFLPVQCVRVWSTGTTATNLVALW
tara:strand:+ start:2314 stop:3051 length:738 start_codon:yes stop_codon:yes gene_type:complete